MAEPFDFDRVIDRSATQSAKWEKYGARDILPMWVADTDFAVAPEIQAALHARAEHPVFGYTEPPPKLFELLVGRMRERYAWEIDSQWIVFLPGIVGALFLACRAIGKAGDPVYLPSIVYPPFGKAPELNDREKIRIPMRQSDARMIIDLDWLEWNPPAPGQLVLMCNPQNPGGAVYRHDELARLAAIIESPPAIR